MSSRKRGRAARWLLLALAAVGALAILWWVYEAVVPEPTDVLPEALSKPPPVPGTPAFAATLSAHLDDPLVDGSRIELLVNGVEIFPPMLEAIRSSTQSVNFLSYVYWTGDVAELVATELSAAARRGVEVRVLLDAYGAKKMREDLVARMEEAGCRVAWFHPLQWYTLRRLNNRTHRKVLVVDGKTAFTGGVGIAAEWTGDAQDPEHWRDDHFRIEGPVVRYLQGSFAENWRQATGEVLAGERMFPPLPPAGDALAVPITSAPSGSISEIGFLYWLSLVSARARVRVATPYFVPDSSLAAVLAAAARRGVEVALLVPGEHNDSKLVRFASRVHYGPLLEAGVRVFEYGPTMMHVKSMTVDRAWAVIGSANFDNRSFELNHEITVAAVDTALVRALDETYDADLAESREVRLEDVRGWSVLERARNRLAFLLREQL